MKAIYFMMAALIISVTALAQGTPHQKEVLKNDIAKEGQKRAEVAKDVFHGEREKARIDNREAIAYHRKIHRDVHQIHQTDKRIARNHPHHVVVRHHYRHHPHHTTVVVVHH